MKLMTMGNGASKGTKVLNMNIGEELGNITSVDWNISTGCVGAAIIYVNQVPVQLMDELNEDAS